MLQKGVSERDLASTQIHVSVHMTLLFLFIRGIYEFLNICIMKLYTASHNAMAFSLVILIQERKTISLLPSLAPLSCLSCSPLPLVLTLCAPKLTLSPCFGPLISCFRVCLCTGGPSVIWTLFSNSVFSTTGLEGKWDLLGASSQPGSLCAPALIRWQWWDHTSVPLAPHNTSVCRSKMPA